MNGDGKDISPIKGVNGLLENAIVANEHLWFATTEGVYRTLLNGSGAERVSGIEANKDGGLRDLLFTYKFVEIGKDVWVITNNGIFRIPSTGASLATTIKVTPDGVFTEQSVTRVGNKILLLYYIVQNHLDVEAQEVVPIQAGARSG